MNKEEYLLITLNEECSELQKEICKVLRFGDGHYPTTMDLTNKERMLKEYYHVVSVFELLVSNGCFDYCPNTECKDDILENKMLMVEKYYEKYREDLKNE